MYAGSSCRAGDAPIARAHHEASPPRIAESAVTTAAKTMLVDLAALSDYHIFRVQGRIGDLIVIDPVARQRSLHYQLSVAT